MTAGKKRIVKDYDKLPEELVAQIKMEYPHGFANNLISYTDATGNKVTALPYETEDIYYLVRMTKQEARQIIEDDEDYDDEGNLRDDFDVDVEGADTDDEEEEDSYDTAKPEDKDDDRDDDY